MTIRLILMFSAFALTHCAGSQTREAPLSPEKLKTYQACRHSEDCIRVDNGCCNCANGGQTVSIHRKHEVEFKKHFPCEMSICTQKAGECVFHEPVCADGFCKLVPQKKKRQ